MLGAHTFAIIFGIHLSLSSIMGRESVMPSCTSHQIPGNPLLLIHVPPSVVFCDVMCTCHACTSLSPSCFVIVCIESLV